KSKFQRLSVRLNLEHQINDWLSGKTHLSYANTKLNNLGQESNSNSLFWFVDNIPPIYGVLLRDADGKKVPDPIFGGYQYDYGDSFKPGRGFALGTNSVADTKYNTKDARRNNLNGGM